MARSIATIQNQILANIAADPDLQALNSPSKRALYRLLSFIMATAIAVFEQVHDVYVATVEALVKTAPAGTSPWLQSRVFEFQYDANNPQILQLNTTTTKIEYPVVDANLRIVTRCSVTSPAPSIVQIKIAKGNPPQKLSANEKSALQDYMDLMGIDGITYQVISEDSDKLMVEADVYYKGQYSGVISGNVQEAIDAYFAKLSSQENFNGKVYLTDLEIAIRNVEGVNDVVLKNVAARAHTTAFAAKTFMVQNNTELQRSWQTFAGYITGETETNYTLNDTLNFIAE